MYIQSYLEKENGTAVIQVVMTAEELDRAVHEEYEKKKEASGMIVGTHAA